MTIEIMAAVTILSVVFGAYSTASSIRRSQKADVKSDATELTTVIVRLENIGAGVNRIENEIIGVKGDVKENRERIITVEASSRQAHKRLDEYAAIFAGRKTE